MLKCVASWFHGCAGNSTDAQFIEKRVFQCWVVPHRSLPVVRDQKAETGVACLSTPAHFLFLSLNAQWTAQRGQVQSTHKTDYLKMDLKPRDLTKGTSLSTLRDHLEQMDWLSSLTGRVEWCHLTLSDGGRSLKPACMKHDNMSQDIS